MSAALTGLALTGLALLLLLVGAWLVEGGDPGFPGPRRDRQDAGEGAALTVEEQTS